ncbi:MAG: ThiF family adenylyltransferase [Moraxellaceae bacterium]|nr:MAG: ThiF family adenylyltransferase [Moraxellaceae bacterium]
MKPISALAIAANMHKQLVSHLFSGDGLESAAILLCSHSSGSRLRLIAKDVIFVNNEDCKNRARNSITWSGSFLEAAIDKAESDQLSIILIHSHPGGQFFFSDTDNESDQITIPCLYHGYNQLHGSAIMIPNGAILARCYTQSMDVVRIDVVTVAGENIHYWWNNEANPGQRPLAFSQNMTRELNCLTATIIGVSGTGSIVAEQLARLGFGSITLIDPDKLEHRNLNRILNSTIGGANANQLKVEAFAEVVSKYRAQDTDIITVASSILSREAVIAASQTDIIFCCVDTLEARNIADLISSTFLTPLLDVGVVIPTHNSKSGITAITEVCGRIDYVQPGGATLSDRGVYDPANLRAEYLRNNSPKSYIEELEDGYFKGVIEEAPSVITLNMRAAADCVNEFIARAYPYRQEPNNSYARTKFSLAAGEVDYFKESSFTVKPNYHLAQGNKEPLLGLPVLKPVNRTSV